LRRVPMPIRHLLRGLGSTDTTGWDLLSYLFFDNAYTSKLLQLGYDDTMRERARVEQFFS
jgi:NTE family protein